MHLYIVGGSGRTGQMVIDNALQRGHTVTALVRNPDALPARDGLTLAKGTPLSPADIATSILHPTLPSAIIVTLNAPRASDSPFAAPAAPPRMMADAHANLAFAMRQHSISKIVTMSAFGVADSGPQLLCALRAVLRGTNMRFQFADHDLVDAEMKAREGLKYVLVRPAMLVEGAEAPVRVFGDEGVGAPWVGRVTRASVAAFLVDACEGAEWDGRTPVIAN
ncbi:nad-dependent epimerase dehydratase [Diplodia corticola]|uniref:Nad-dependent epimerase dehydratase n=1 Tax=Diplodia corticola TaxID=236234 RepID=A0A1J9S203_9PEZI|nr:nad-dependent epimerase dehydratase [Diplodia corticola]OJD33677.1 nad-dependent epimerase dehydratase [Diplodia corticola]